MEKLGNAHPLLQEGDGGRSIRDWGRSPSYYNADPMMYGLLKGHARENRKNMTLGERVLWDRLKGKQLGVTFLRQYIIGDYIADFACLEAHLVVEVDGGYHSEPRQQEDDACRQQWLEEHGFHVIRFTNEQVEFDTAKCVLTIKTYLSNSNESK